MKNSQIKMVIEQLIKDGFISRNYCLSKGCTRLGAIIGWLKIDGWVFDEKPSKKGNGVRVGHFVQKKYGQDYQYDLVSKPKNI